MMTQGLTLLAGMSALYIFGGHLLDGLQKNLLAVYSRIGTYELTPENVHTLFITTSSTILLLLLPIVSLVMITGVLSHIMQDKGRFELRWERMAVKFEKLNPLNGVKKLFNKDALVEILKSLLKMAIIGWIAYRVMQDELQNLMFLAESDISEIVTYAGHVAFKIVIHTCGILLLISILDLAYVKWRHIENLKMTKQEVKDEHKNQEGDPKVKSKLKSLQFQAARRRLTAIIPTADVIITNPTHYAVALKYDRASMMAPMVIAKGVDEMAQAIKAMGREHKITLVENRHLARELYDQVKENQEIPEALYAAVAEILAHVYRLKGIV